MDRWSEFFVRWKLAIGVFLPLFVLSLAFVMENPLAVLGASLFVGLALGVVYLFAQYAETTV